MTQAFKNCPKCAAPAEASATQCSQCGHIFRTQLAAVGGREAQAPAPDIHSPAIIVPLGHSRAPSTLPVEAKRSDTGDLAVTAAPIFRSQVAEAVDNGHAPAIVAMWLLYALALMLHGTRPVLVGVALIAIGIAVFLIFQKDRNDKINGWVAIGIGIASLLFAFSAGGQAPPPAS